ncbi:ADP-ribosylglycohydrolase family protein [Shewanella sp. 1CM18E]|uniref:ADP-ribosylglycohydrolase family protein n=1 Tax=Shewanella sp. 1CM18E TaxID=2929169 RepID=UPI0020BFE44B|nr:ADP-ribosylglycohydrolase family protein [Shewanella sp. 1CM18E]MCK8045318.1 ADP-ribosylglycohydrolase family protein [Shewanella sp. 1CM18E]
MLSFDEFKLRRAQGALLGLACGDALGTTLEFKPKDSYQPLTDMVGGGPFKLKAGQWTDDTAMMLCLADSLVEKGSLDLSDQAMRYLRWYQEGENSCTGTCFDIGNTVRDALMSYKRSAVPESGSTAEYAAGNGSLMRIAPVALFYANATEAEAMEAAAQSSKVTHAEQRCIEACELMTLLIHRILNSECLPHEHFFITQGVRDYLNYRPDCHADIRAICEGDFIDKPREAIRGTGFVIDAFEAALWCFCQSDNFEQGALLAANLGEDADTTAAIYGQLAGAFYGELAIPKGWLNKLAWQRHIADTASWLIARPDNQLVASFIELTRKQINGLESRDVPLYSTAYRYGLMVSHISYEAPFSRIRLDCLADFSDWLETASFRDCVSWLIRVVRFERCMDGTIAACIEDGSLELLLRRLEVLVSSSLLEPVASEIDPLAAILKLVDQGELWMTGSIKSLETFARVLQSKAISLMALPRPGERLYVVHPLQGYESKSAYGVEPHNHNLTDEEPLWGEVQANWNSDTKFNIHSKHSGLFELEIGEGIRLFANVFNEEGEKRLTIYEKESFDPRYLSQSLSAMMNAWQKCDAFRHEPQYLEAVKQLSLEQEASGTNSERATVKPWMNDINDLMYWRGYELGVSTDESAINIFEHRTNWTGPHESIMEVVVVESFAPDVDKSTVTKYLSFRAKQENPMVICQHCGKLTWADWHMGDGLCESCACAIKGIVF